MVSGVADQVTVTSVRAQPFTRDAFPSDDYTLIRCNYEADGGPGQIITTDTRTRETTMRDNTGASPNAEFPMPPAVVKLNGIDSAVASVVVQSDHYLYQGSIIAEYAVNGQRSTVSLGNPKAPYRWAGGDVSDLVNSGDTWDWNPREDTWEQGIDLAAIYPR